MRATLRFPNGETVYGAQCIGWTHEAGFVFQWDDLAMGWYPAVTTISERMLESWEVEA